jgi:hypothetical protein
MAEIVGEKKSRELKEAVHHLEPIDNLKDLAELLAFCPA